ncbi:MAG: GNAT family N-acetyltransferase [Pseudomonadota bacterium]
MTGPRCTRWPEGAAAEAARRHRDALKTLETARLVLRAPTLDDLPLWTELLAGPDARHLGGPLDAEEAWEAFCVYVAGWLLHGDGLWTVDRKAATEDHESGAAIGFVLIGLEWGDEEPELGGLLTPEHRGQGYAAEAAAAARDEGLAMLGGLVSYIDADNAPPGRLARRLGAVLDRADSLRLGVQVWRHVDPARAVRA